MRVTKLPEPDGIIDEMDVPRLLADKRLIRHLQDGGCMPFYTEAQMLQFRRDALEEAAKLCCTLHSNDQTNILYAAKKLRKLKDKT